MSKRPLSSAVSATGGASAASSSSSSAPDAKRAKFDDVVSSLAADYGGAAPKASSIGGIVLGELPVEHKSYDRAADDNDGGDADVVSSSSDPRFVGLSGEEELDAILKLVEDAPEVPELTESDVKSILTRFSKAVAKNLELRARYPDEPRKFMESELALDEAAQALTPISSNTSFYPLLLTQQAGGETTMDNLCMLLLNHENIDVAIDALNLLHELIDAEELDTDDESLQPFVDYVCGSGSSPFLSTLVRSLSRFPVESSKSFSDAVTHVLGILENLTDLRPKEVAEKLIAHTDIIEWTMTRMKQDMFDANKLYASEILSIILTNTGAAGQEQLGSKVMNGNGIKQLVKFIAKYRKEDPSNDEETEYVENLFDILCLVLHDHPGNQSRFARHDGLQLMLTMIRRNTYAKNVAFKAISYAIMRDPTSSGMLIDEGGLKTVFAALMHEPSSKKERAAQTAHEQHLLEIITQLFLNTSDVRYLRLRRKFEEQEMVKTERIVELLVKYQTRVEDAEAKHRATSGDTAVPAAASSNDAISEEELLRYSRQSDHGLTHVELAAITLAFLATSGNKELRARIDQLLNQQDLSVTDLERTLQTYTRMMGEQSTNEETNKTKAVLEALIAMIKEP